MQKQQYLQAYNEWKEVFSSRVIIRYKYREKMRNPTNKKLLLQKAKFNP